MGLDFKVRLSKTTGSEKLYRNRVKKISDVFFTRIIYISFFNPKSSWFVVFWNSWSSTLIIDSKKLKSTSFSDIFQYKKGWSTKTNTELIHAYLNLFITQVRRKITKNRIHDLFDTELLLKYFLLIFLQFFYRIPTFSVGLVKLFRLPIKIGRLRN